MRWKTDQVGPIAIDFGARALRVLQVRRCGRGGSFQVTAARSRPVEPGSGTDAAVLGSKLASMLAGKDFSGRAAVTCLASADLDVKNMRLPTMPEAELAAAVEFEVGERFGSTGGETVTRFLPAGRVGGEGGSQQEVILLAASTSSIDARLRLLTDAGLKVTAIEPPANAFFRPYERFLRRASDAQQTNAFVDLGARGSRVIITRGSEIVFFKTCPVGGDALDEAVATKLSIELNNAATLRRRCLAGESSSAVEAHRFDVVEAIRPPLQQLGKEIGLCLRYYAVTFRGARPEQVACGGSEAGWSDVREWLSDTVQLPMVVGGAFRGVEVGPLGKLAAGGELCEWNTAIGLALRDVVEGQGEAKVA